jgi:hypothetical protein
MNIREISKKYLFFFWSQLSLALCRAAACEGPIILDRRHASPLRKGRYLCWSRSEDLSAVALSDGFSPKRRAVWLLEPGANILWLELQEDWPAPQFMRLGGEGNIASEPCLHLRPLRGIHGVLHLTLATILRATIDEVLLAGMGRYFVFCPKRMMIEERTKWHQWAHYVPELTVLNLEDWIPPVLEGKYPSVGSAMVPAHTSHPDNDVPIPPAIGAHVHLHYLDVWPELREDLKKLPPDARVVVSISNEAVPAKNLDANEIIHDVHQLWQRGKVVTTINRGRDIGPFMQLLAEGEFDGLTCLCKIHGKKSFRLEKATYLGEVWRRYPITEILPDNDRLHAILLRFSTDAKLGMLGPSRLRLPSARVRDVIEDDGGLLRQIMHNLFGKDVTTDLTFFAGTMFWVRPEALARVRRPVHNPWLFPPEPLGISGSLAHALERLLPTSVVLAGYKVENLPSPPYAALS